jgi:hypothetical protein
MEEILPRYERKFLAEGFSKTAVEMIIKRNPAGFSEIFYERTINNIYFDTHNFQFYFDNSFGKSTRKKFRIRWYGDLFGVVKKPVLEIKMKFGATGEKLSFPLKSFTLDQTFTIDNLINIFQESGLPHHILEDVLVLEPLLLNRYTRKYYLSHNKDYRATIDYELSYTDIGRRNNSFLKHVEEYGKVLVELKYNNDKDENAGFISNSFPFRMTKNSKYVSGIDLIYNKIPL